jgi:hypothetical protein
MLALSVPNVCVVPAAVVKAHQAYEIKTGKERPDITNMMIRELPSNIQQRLSGKIQINYTPESTLNYSELRQLGIPDCDTKRPVVRHANAPNPIRAIFGAFSFLGADK